MRKFSVFACVCCVALIFVPQFVQAEYLRGKVVEAGETNVTDPYNNITEQQITISSKGESYQTVNTGPGLEAGDRVFVQKENNQYSVISRDYLPTLVALVVLFVVAVLMLSYKKGIRSLGSLAITMFGIFGLYIPLLVAGYSPVLLSILVGILLSILTIYITHGYNRISTSACLGTLVSVIVAVCIALIAIKSSGLNGFGNEEIVFLAGSLHMNLDFVGILVGGIIIAMLGVLDDIAVTQAAVVAELKHTSPGMGMKQYYASAMKIGTAHAGALVNTLVFVFIGTSLPLVLLFAAQDTSILYILQQETIVLEIIRTIAGSIGLVICVPVTTLVSLYLIRAKDGKGDIHVCKHNH
jgi:uncharacterized membrane protein